MKKPEDLSKELFYKRPNFWKTASEKEAQAAMDFAGPYRDFLNRSKTVRETVSYVENALTEAKFANLDSGKKAKKVYRIAHRKNVGIAVFGKQPVSAGVNIVAAHIDSPRVDLKQSPMDEDASSGTCIMKTHYYGGIRKYQWMSTPLALHGTVIRKDGSAVEICIGEDENDPVFIMPDLLPHLARKEQGSKSIFDAIEAGRMNVVFSSVPFLDPEDNTKDVTKAVSLKAMQMLHERYGIVEEDFFSAELELVPAGKSRDAGLDGSMVSGYGQDDRMCGYTAFRGIMDLKNPDKAAVVILIDKEEIGSEGVTGATSIFMVDFICDLLKANGEAFDSHTLRKTLINTQILSADVCVAIDPNWPGVHEKANACMLNCGIGLTKFTGVAGKSGSSDCNAEFMARVIRLFNEEGIIWQYGALGKTDEGGGGTIAKYLAQHGCSVLDCGPGIMGMHSLYELTGKADIYTAYRAYKAFLTKA